MSILPLTIGLSAWSPLFQKREEQMSNKKCVIYARQSSDDKDREKFSVPYQKKRCEQYRIEKAFRLAHKAFEETASGYKGTRKQFDDMLSFIEAENIAILLVTELDRLYRNSKDDWRIQQLLELSCLEEIHFVDEGRIYTPDDIEGWLMQKIKGTFAEFESRQRARKVSKVMHAMFEKGIYPTVAPIGYLNVADSTDPTGRRRTIVIDQERGHLVKKGFELYATGEYSYETLTIKLRAMGLTGGGKRGALGRLLTVKQVESMLQNKFYYGIMSWDGVEGSHKYQKLIDKSLFDKCQKVRKRQAKCSWKGKEFPFKVVLECGFCGCSITGVEQRENGNVWRYYRCTYGKDKANGQKCPNLFHREEKVDQFFARQIDRLAFPKQIASFVADMVRVEYLKENEYRLKEYDRLKKELSRIEREKKIVYSDRIKGRIDEEFLVEQWNELVEQEVALKEEIEKLELKNETYVEETDVMLAQLANISEVYATADRMQKARILSALFSKVDWKVYRGADGCKKIKAKVFWHRPFDVLSDLKQTYKVEERDTLVSAFISWVRKHNLPQLQTIPQGV